MEDVESRQGLKEKGSCEGAEKKNQKTKTKGLRRVMGSAAFPSDTATILTNL